MALLTQSQINDVTKLAVTMFGAAPGAFKDFLQEVYVANGTDLQATANAYASEPAFSTMFTGTNEDKADMLMERFGIEQSDMENGQPVGQAAYDFFLGSLNNGESVQDIIAVTIPYIYEDPNFSVYATILDNKVAVANAFTNGNGAAVTDLSVLQTVVAGVNENTDMSGLVTASLTTGQDNVFGTSANDIFAANLSANADTLQSGDYINGGAGIDTLNATLAFTPYAITPQTESVEILNVRSQSNLGDGAGDNEVEENGIAGDANTIDAQDMNGTREFWNTDSRADLVVEDVRHNSHETTVGWRQTDAGTDGTAVDYAVYFDHDHITSPDSGTIGGTLTLTVADLDLLDTTVDTSNPNNGDPFDAGFPYDILNINFDGVDYDLNVDYTNVSDWADLAAEINVALADAGLANLQAGVSGSTNVIHPVTGNNLTVDQIVISKIDASAPGNFDAAASTWDTTGSVPGDTAYLTRIQDEQAVQKPSLTQVDVVLDHVGRGEKAGVLEIGNISNIADNTHAYSKGIEQFNVEVDRDSYFGILKSTSNGVQDVDTSLEVVNVVNIAENSDGTGDLRIDGFESTAGLTDVRVFDASAMVGNVTITAELTEQVVAKYMDLQDEQANPAGDNSDPVDYLNVVDTYFSYDFGEGNDNLEMVISKSNLAAAGTTNREDFVLGINGNDGNDSITTQIGDGAGVVTDAWYINSALNANLTITTGNGADMVHTNGAGNWIINTGSANDVVYTDNSGTENATYVFNTTDQAGALAAARDIDDLESDANDTYELYKAQLTVSFRGLDVTVTVPSTQYITSDLQVNQAIKEAINSNAPLNALLKAEDGPANTLVITSLIDGDDVLSDLAITLAASNSTDWNASERAQAESAWGLADDLPATINAAMAVETGAFAAKGDYDTAFANDTVADIDGVDSAAVNGNTITGDTGNDIIVLSTDSNDTSNETVKFGYNFGSDVVVNFTTDVDTQGLANGADLMDFTNGNWDTVATGATFTNDVGGVITAADLDQGDVAIIDFGSFTPIVGVTYANMTEADVVAMLNADVDADATGLNTETDHAMVLIALDGDNQFKVYETTSVGDDADFSGVTYMGTINMSDTDIADLTAPDIA